MLDKSKINNLRDLLVGVVPNPVDQVKQITIALVYKFMNDMDDFNQNFAGKRIYFVKDYAQFAWSKLMDDKLTNLERLNLYADALQQIELNQDIPDVFQHIFKGAFLSYRNPETLTLFLKEISGFDYNQDSEQLGDAFEYLLSILGSQKDAGQFRTPRHIIDFMVKVIKPTKNDSILDPACGTAGFLISAFQYIRDTANLQLSEFSQVFNNIYGYDITPDMVKIALINLYLHRDTNPHIYEYDTLSNDEKWGEKFNVILANPPFMTPKGGIKPHSKFRLKATKSEVLFCDYILEHLRLNGRAGIVVPEGIIFQSGNVYKQLREMLVMGENNQGNLIAVISLPSGVFKPYSGVKTSILILDKQAAKAKESILLVKINNDGYDLGDKRNPITANDLPQALALIEYYQQHNQLPEDNPFSTSNAQLISKQQLKENDFNLSFDRYKTSATQLSSHYPMVKLGDVCEVISGQSPESKYYNVVSEGLPFYQGRTEFGEMYLGNPKVWTTEITRTSINGDIVMSVRAPVGPVNLVNFDKVCIGRGLAAIRSSHKINRMFIFYFLKNKESEIKGNGGAVFDSINRQQIMDIEIPLPPMEVQQKIVAEIEQYQKVMDGAKLIVDNYKPKININQEWQTAKLSDVCEVTSSKRIFQNEYCSNGVPFYRTKEVVELSKNNEISLELFISDERYNEIKKSADIPKCGDILISSVGTIGAIWVVDDRKFYFKDGNLIWLKNINNIIPLFLKLVIKSFLESSLNELINGAAYKALTIVNLKQITIPVPTLEEQQKIVAELEHERTLVDNAKQLIDIMQNKINFTISQLWQSE